ncbi:hypothetical protein Fuma_04032 [Fuerstiella marisgermanici]|uniref:Uncharacterized protein n=1 Tax=Fuerstiella marisgermanici TaxID=1891926 RepID=A0A1P8WK05_9PLAN|nr:hypothetical protein Fuma_04032 [Fuerstiella marisgermanici]
MLAVLEDGRCRNINGQSPSCELCGLVNVHRMAKTTDKPKQGRTGFPTNDVQR